MRNCKDQLSHPSLSHTEQECQEGLIQGKIHITESTLQSHIVITESLQSLDYRFTIYTTDTLQIHITESTLQSHIDIT